MPSTTRSAWNNTMRLDALLRRTTVLIVLACSDPTWAADPPPTSAPPPGLEDELEEATSTSARAVALYREGKFAEAAPVARRAVQLLELVFGPDHLNVASGLCNLATILNAQGAHAEARPLFERALAIRETTLGRDHPDVAFILDSLAHVLFSQGAHAETRVLLERALAIREKTLGTDHPEVASSLNKLAILLQSQGKFGDARALAERSLALAERTLGHSHPLVSASLGTLAGILWNLGAYSEARPLFERALELQERALGREHPTVALAQGNLAVLLDEIGETSDARTLHERSLATLEKTLGKDHPSVGRALRNLAVGFRAQGAYAEARSLLERALEIAAKALGKEHRDVAATLQQLARLHHSQANYAAARTLYDRSLAITERALGKDHPDVAGVLNDQAALLVDQGSYTEARPLFERALLIVQNALGGEHSAYATVLHSLAQALHYQGAYEDARRHYERGLAIKERSLGEDHRDVSTFLSDLADLRRAQGALGDATRLHERAVAIAERRLGGGDHPDLAAALLGLARVLRVRGDYARAVSLAERANRIYEVALGSDHPRVATSLGERALLRQAQGDYADARQLYERLLAIIANQLRQAMASLSGRQRLALLRSVRHDLDNWLLFVPRVRLSGYAELLRFRGLVARAETAERTLSRRATGEERELHARLAAAQRRASRLANEVPATRDADVRAAWQKRYAEATAEREQLTLELSRRVAPLRAALERLDLSLADVQAAVPADGALVDFLRVGDRYLAWVVRRTGEPVRIDLGSADDVENACARFVEEIVNDERGDGGAPLRALVWAPVQARLGDDVQRVFVCPDAALASIPFGALPGREPGRRLLDEYALAHVSSAQDLVPWKDPPAPGRGALLVGGVDYDRASAPAAEEVLPEATPTALAAVDRAPRGESFPGLPETKPEVEALAAQLGKDGAAVLLGTDATEARLRRLVKGRRLLHVATHGFAREDLLKGLYERKVAEAFLSADAERQLAVGHDPMLLSGLAMAGANPREGGGDDDGVLTALEASYLDLDGVDLVTLSACETARGTAEGGEGVQGLVSAFRMAGAAHVVASLWKVDDTATRLLMERLYALYLDKLHPRAPAEALREAALWLRDAKPGGRDYAAPRYWAAFVAYGR